MPLQRMHFIISTIYPNTTYIHTHSSNEQYNMYAQYKISTKGQRALNLINIY